MRTEQEMMELIIGTAKKDDRIRAVIMYGSRTNPNVKKDILQDYDIVYVVRDIGSFTSDHGWVDIFGERIMMQMPEDHVLPPAQNDGRYIYLMQFTDGNRIDLTLIPVEKREELLVSDSLSVLLLDKDGLLGEFKPPCDRDYWIRRPSEKEYVDICNEFWWICMNVAKGLWRNELPYAMFMHEQVNRNVLITMLEWYIGIKTDFGQSAGKHGKYMKDFLDAGEWKEYTATYSDAKLDNVWRALFAMCSLFQKTAIYVGDQLGFEYPAEDDRKVTEYLYKIKRMSRECEQG